MRLGEEEQGMLAGEQGPVRQWAMRHQIAQNSLAQLATATRHQNLAHLNLLNSKAFLPLVLSQTKPEQRLCQLLGTRTEVNSR